MKAYERPLVVVNEALAEGIYANSGLVGMDSSCFNESHWIGGTPYDGYPYYDVYVSVQHNATADQHTSAVQIVTVTFNQPVNCVEVNMGSVLGNTNGSSSVAVKIDTSLGAYNAYDTALKLKIAETGTPLAFADGNPVAVGCA